MPQVTTQPAEPTTVDRRVDEPPTVELPRQGLNPAGKRFIALVLSSAIALAGIEIAVRLLGLGVSRVGFRATSVPAVIPGDLDLDWAAPPPHRVRVLVVGDSFTWGDGVLRTDAYPARLGVRLEAKQQPFHFDVINAGFNGNNSADELERVGWVFNTLSADPDLVVLGFCLNDPEPSEPARLESLRAPLTRRIPPAGNADAVLYRHLHSFRVLYQRLENTRQRRAFGTYYQRLFDPAEPFYADSVAAITGLRDLLAARSIPLLIAVFPVFDSQLDARYPYRAHHQQIVTSLRAEQIPVIDLLPSFEGIDANRLAVVPFTDPHPNELAHRIAAEVLADLILECLGIEPRAGGYRGHWRCGLDGKRLGWTPPR